MFRRRSRTGRRFAPPRTRVSSKVAPHAESGLQVTHHDQAVISRADGVGERALCCRLADMGDVRARQPVAHPLPVWRGQLPRSAGHAGVFEKWLRAPPNPAGAREPCGRTVRAVGRRGLHPTDGWSPQHEHTLVVAANPIELSQELVDGRSHRTCVKLRTALSKSIELVDEQNARSVAPGEVEQLMKVALAVSDPHVEHIVDRHRQQSRPQLTGKGSSDE